MANKPVHNSAEGSCLPPAMRIISTEKGTFMIALNVLNLKQYASLYPSEKYAYDHCEVFAVQDWNQPRRAEIGRTTNLEEAYAIAQRNRAAGGKPMVHAVARRGHEECFCFIPAGQGRY